MGEVFGGFIMIFMIGLITSPKYFFTKVDEHILNEPKKNTYVSHVNVSQVLHCFNEERMILDEIRITNFNSIIASCVNPDAKRIWEIKKAEYLRNVRWNRLVEMCDASERTKGL